MKIFSKDEKRKSDEKLAVRWKPRSREINGNMCRSMNQSEEPGLML
jgi:hypothetical protein